jgi:hypothetical protein
MGGLSVALQTMTDALFRPIMGRPNKPEWRVEDVPLLGRFVKELPPNHSRYVTEFYDMAKGVEEAYGSYRDALKRGDQEAARKMLAKDLKKIRLHGSIAEQKRNLSESNQAIKATYDSRKLTPEEKRERIDKLRNAQHRVAQRAVTSLQKAL